MAGGNLDPGTNASDERPLPLSDFEYYMFVDDRATHPMVFSMVVHLDGCLLKEPFETSVDEALEFHLLFACHVQKVATSGWCWVHQPDAALPVEWRTVDSPMRLNDPVRIRSMNLRQQCGIVIDVSHFVDSSRIVFYLHHACCDGIGALQFIGEVLARYGQKTASEDTRRPDFEPPQISMLLQRDHYDTGKSATERHQRSRKKIIGKIWRLLGRRPVSLQPLSKRSAVTANSPDEVPCAIQSRVLPRTINRGLRAAANQKRVSVNDLCIREMLLQIHDWNHRAGPVRGNPWLRISVPVSMRTADHQYLPACNMVSYSFVTRRDSECHDEDRLLASIHEQTDDVLFNRSGIVALKFLGFLRKVPGMMKLVLGMKSCFCTVVLANVGDVRRRFSGRFPLQHGKWVAGNVVVEHLCGVAPVRPNTRAAVTIGEYAGDLSIHLRTDSTVIGADDSARFLAEYSARLIRLAEHENDGLLSRDS